MKTKSKYALILASGGIDSTACINFYKNIKFNIDALFVDYGQLSYRQEFMSVSKICNYYKIPLRKAVIKSGNSAVIDHLFSHQTDHHFPR